MHAQEGHPVYPKSLADQLIEARLKAIKESGEQLDPRRQRTNPNDESNLGERVLAPKPQGIAADRYIVGRPPGSTLNPIAAGQGLDRLGRPVHQPSVADLREHLPGGDAE